MGLPTDRYRILLLAKRTAEPPPGKVQVAHDQWQTQDGQKRQRHYIIADNIEFLDAA